VGGVSARQVWCCSGGVVCAARFIVQAIEKERWRASLPALRPPAGASARRRVSMANIYRRPAARCAVRIAAGAVMSAPPARRSPDAVYSRDARPERQSARCAAWRGSALISRASAMLSAREGVAPRRMPPRRCVRQCAGVLRALGWQSRSGERAAVLQQRRLGRVARKRQEEHSQKPRRAVSAGMFVEGRRSDGGAAQSFAPVRVAERVPVRWFHLLPASCPTSCWQLHALRITCLSTPSS